MDGDTTEQLSTKQAEAEDTPLLPVLFYFRYIINPNAPPTTNIRFDRLFDWFGFE